MLRNTKGRISADKEGNKKSLGAHAKDNLTSAIVSLIHNENFRNDHYELIRPLGKRTKCFKKTNSGKIFDE